MAGPRSDYGGERQMLHFQELKVSPSIRPCWSGRSKLRSRVLDPGFMGISYPKKGESRGKEHGKLHGGKCLQAYTSHKPINGIGFRVRGLGFKVLQTRNVPPWAPPKPALEGMS